MERPGEIGLNGPHNFPLTPCKISVRMYKHMYRHSDFLLGSALESNLLNILQTDTPDTNVCGCEEMIATDLETAKVTVILRPLMSMYHQIRHAYQVKKFGMCYSTIGFQYKRYICKLALKPCYPLDVPSYYLPSTLICDFLWGCDYKS